jgi:flagellar hook-associated protein 1 FlgK
MSISALFDIGRSALQVSQMAMNTVAHNVANASTPGYTRQNVVVGSVSPGLLSSQNMSGRGVQITSIQRMYDSFTSLQLRTEQSKQAYWDTSNAGYSQIDNIFNESGMSSIGTTIDNFFNAWQDLATSPDSYATRSMLLDQAKNLASRVSSAATDIDAQRTDIYKSSRTLTDQVNSLTKQISDLNEKVAEAPGLMDLRDQRDNLIDSLNKLVKVSTFEDNSERTTVLLGGLPLVDSAKSYDLSLSLDNANKMHFNIQLSSTESHDVTTNISGGNLGANLDMRDTKLLDYGNKLNAFAINLADAVNFYHKQGYGTDGSTGNDFFSFNNSLVTYTNPAVGSLSTYNVTDATVFGNNSNAQYNIDYLNAAGYGALAPAAQANYQLEPASIPNVYWQVQQSTDNGITWSVVAPANVAVAADTSTTPNFRTLDFNGIRVRIDGDQAALSVAASGAFNLQQNTNAAMSLATAITDPSKIAAAAGDIVTLDGSNNSIQYSTDGGSTFSTARIATGTYTRRQLGAALQASVPNIAVTYTPGTKAYSITNNNANTLVMDWTSKSTTTGGFFGFSASSYIAAAGTTTGSSVYPLIPGDNGNARLIADQANQLIMPNGAKPSDFYQQLVSSAGVDASLAKSSASYYASLVEQLDARRQQTSGVNLDEEAINLVKYQKTYQAAAKILTITDQLFTTLMNMTGG